MTANLEILTHERTGVLEIPYRAVIDDSGQKSVRLVAADGKSYVSAGSDRQTKLAAPGLPFSLVFRAEPGREDTILEIAAAYEAASKRRVPPPDFGPL